MVSLKILTFDSNQISTIESDALINCRSLEKLSLAQNYLTLISVNNFYYLFSLTYLNVSFNRIEWIELNSFQNLNKLLQLDLSFNCLHLIEDNLFNGLSNLLDLRLVSRTPVKLSDSSFAHLSNISNIYLNETTLNEYKCLFMHSIERKVQRNVGNRYKFFKSINLLTANSNLENKSYCEFVFELFQFKIHLNLKTDYQNEQFYEKCRNYLIRRENHLYHNLKHCSPNLTLADYDYESRNAFKTTMLNDYTFYLVLFMLFSLFVSIMLMVCHNLHYNLGTLQCHNMEQSVITQHSSARLNDEKCLKYQHLSGLSIKVQNEEVGII